jgi:methylthioribulose-1-phosphate dehydratase
LDLPVFANDQDIPRLAAAVEPVLAAGTPLGYLIRGHGVYVWGPDMPMALARLEGLEFLLACELERRKLRQ